MDVGIFFAGSHTEQHWRCCRISNPEDLSERKDLNLHANARGVEHLQINKDFRCFFGLHYTRDGWSHKKEEWKIVCKY